MAERLAVTGSHRCLVHITPEAAIAVSGTCPETALLVDDHLIVAVTGRPRFDLPELEKLAQGGRHAEAVREAYRREGMNLLSTLGGAFSLVVVDRHLQSALLATDRMGIHTLAYGTLAGSGLAFASTLDALRVHPGVNTEIDLQSLYAYLYFHVVPSPTTVYRGCRKLRPAEYITLRHGRSEQGYYWEPNFVDDGADSQSVLAEELRETLRVAVRRCKPGTDSAAFLSGGIDSSAVAGMLTEIGPRPARTFSIGFAAKGYDEIHWARTTARHFATEQHEYYVTPDDVVRTAPAIAAVYDEPFGNSSAVPVYCCARFARDHGVRLMLAGDGGDELFGGNARYAKQKVFDLYHRIPESLRAGLIEPLLFSIPGAGRIAPLRKLRSYVAQARVPMPDRLETYNFFHRTPAAEMLDRDFLAALDLDMPIAMQRETYARARSAALVNRMLFLDWKFTLADNDLRKVSRMCQLAGVEVHYPWLDDDLVRLSTRVPARLKVKGTRLRYFVKEALRNFLPLEVIRKPKHGFGLPFGVWMREHKPLQELTYDSLARLGRRGYFRPGYLDTLIRQHREEHASYFGEFIWALMMLELWLEAHGHRP
jgi:asparagine synthase (glutamine-hydrolysing)